MTEPAPTALYRPPGVVLAGGRSSRMGSDKAMIALGGKTLLQHVVARLMPQTQQLAVNSNSLTRLDFAPEIFVFPDTVKGQAGPMAGVLSAMRHVASVVPQASHVVTVPTDTPFFPLDFVARLAAAVGSENRIAVARSGGALHPIFALWPVGLADDLESWLVTDQKRRVRAFLERHAAREVDFPADPAGRTDIEPFFNINTPDDAARAGRWLARTEDQPE